MQHDIYNWHVDDLSFVKLERISPESKFITDCVNIWLKESMPDSKARERLVQSIFEAEEKTGVDEVGTILKNPKKFILDFLRHTNGIDKQDRKLMTKAFMDLIMTMVKNYPSYLKDKSEYANKKQK